MAAVTRLGLYGGPRAPYPGFAPAAASVSLSGTIIGADEQDIRDGSRTIILTVANDTWVAAGATFNAVRQAIIDGLDSAGVEATGWNAEVRDKEVVTAVARTSDTVVTITLSAAAAYDITGSEEITATVPASALVLASSPVIATPTFTIVIAVVADERRGGPPRRKHRRVMIDGKLHTVRTLAEERALLARYIEQQRMVLETAEPAQELGIRAKIRRAERRVVKVVSEESIEADDRLLQLRSEDEDILLLLVH